ncbi:MAG: hypothetical protein HQM08_24810 [Candidatus Riflebacteria bacterium]|nr:hypothetical protein [Candidatus Riflebacteria bacterium]
MKYEHRSAFTLIELLLVVFLAICLLIPGYRLFRSSSQSSIQGIQQIDMVSEGSRIIRQIHNDLKSACIALASIDTQYSFSDFVRASGGSSDSLAGTTFSFLSFPQHGDLDKAVSLGVSSGQSIKCANEISYSLKASGKPNVPFLILTRTEKTHPKLGEDKIERVLSQRVNFIAIQPIEIPTTSGRNQWIFNITLQLAEARNPGNLMDLSKNGLVLNSQSGLMISDFFDVVCPTFFEAVWNRNNANRNWQTVVQAP